MINIVILLLMNISIIFFFGNNVSKLRNFFYFELIFIENKMKITYN